MSQCKLIWITPNCEQMVSDIARVSNPANQGLPPGKLLGYCVRNQHWSPFEMANAVVEINTTRTIARQILRHRSFSFQEFSQRYASVTTLPPLIRTEARLQHPTNRQSSIELDETDELNKWWAYKQDEVDRVTSSIYKEALEKGMAKEVARDVLPEGMTPSRMYMNGTIRSWMHFVQLRRGNGTQKEHQEIANAISDILRKEIPLIWENV
jgi:thymidylate synthase (FAD)